ncbi:unnamed protein product, partial [Effrenium voratum]
MMEAVWAHKRQQLEKAKQKSDERLETESWMVRLKRRRSEIEQDAIEDFAAETGFRPDTDTAPGGAGTVYGWNPATAGWLAAPSTPGYYNQAKPGGVATDPATAGGIASAARHGFLNKDSKLVDQAARLFAQNLAGTSQYEGVLKNKKPAASTTWRPQSSARAALSRHH